MTENIKFNKIKKLENGFLVDKIFVPKDSSNRHYKELLKFFNENPDLEEKIYTIEKRNRKIVDIKNEARFKISAQYDDIKQRNILMSQDASQINDMNIFIQNIRDQSNFLEAQVADMDLDQLNSFDPSSDDNWS